MHLKQFLLILTIICIHPYAYSMDDDQDDMVALAKQLKYEQYEQVLSNLHKVSIKRIPEGKLPSLLKKLVQMIQQGIDPNHQSKVGEFFRNFTGLIVCVENSAQPTLKKLIAMGANPDLQDVKGKTALYRAVQYHPACIVDLLKAKASIMITKRSGKTALSAAVHNGDEKSARLLLYLLITEMNKANATEIGDLIERVYQGQKEDHKSHNKNIQTMLAQPQKIYTHIEDDSGEITQEQASACSSQNLSTESPNEGTQFRSILYARKNIEGNVLLHLRARQGAGLPMKLQKTTAQAQPFHHAYR